jgi:hypothetical protein
MTQLRCSYCGRLFKPKLRKGRRQVTCGAEACKAAHKRVLGQRWWAENPERTLGRQEKKRAWAHQLDYWKCWRGVNPEYVELNRVQTRERMRRLREEKRKARAVLADPEGYLRGLKARCVEDVCKPGTGQAPAPTVNAPTADDVCKPGTGRQPLVEVVEFLLIRECLQTRNGLFAARLRGDNAGDAGRGAELI